MIYKWLQNLKKTIRSFPVYSRLLTPVLLLFTVGCSQKIDTHREFVEVAYQHERSGQLPEAVVAYKKALELNPKSATTWYDLGVAFAAMEQFPDAVDAYTRAVELDSAMAQAFNNRAAAYAALKQLESAVKDCDQAIALEPTDFLAWRNRGLAHHDLGDREKAISDYDESIRLNGRSAATYLYRGNVYMENEAWQRALEDFNHAIHLDAALAAAWHSKAKTLVELGKPDEAKESSQTAMELGADVSDVFAEDLDAAVAPVAAAEQLDSAAEFAKTWLTNKGTEVTDSDSPWDLSSTEDNNSERYVVRVVSSSMTELDVRFSSHELDQIKSAEGVSRNLIILERLTNTSTGTDLETFRVLKYIENWHPDLSAMKPLSWSLPVETNPADESTTN